MATSIATKGLFNTVYWHFIYKMDVLPAIGSKNLHSTFVFHQETDKEKEAIQHTASEDTSLQQLLGE